MRIALTTTGPRHLNTDSEIWEWVSRGVDVLVARPLIRKPRIRITRHYQSPGFYRPSYSDREMQATDLWQAVYDDSPDAITQVIKRARKAGLIG